VEAGKGRLLSARGRFGEAEAAYREAEVLYRDVLVKMRSWPMFRSNPAQGQKTQSSTASAIDYQTYRLGVGA
jgi:hypothetical protein